jgi:hypothetical protein
MRLYPPLFIILCALSAYGCRTDMLLMEQGDPSSARKVLIAGESTPFKEKAVKSVVQKLGTLEYYFKIEGTQLLEEQDRERFGAILLATWYSQKKIMDQRVIDFLAADPRNPKVIVLYTHGGQASLPDSLKPDVQVDAVSSPSLDERVETAADSLAFLIRNRWGP